MPTNKNNDDFSSINIYSGEDHKIQLGSLSSISISESNVLGDPPYQIGTLTNSSNNWVYNNSSSTFTFDDICNKNQYQEEILEKINELPLEEMPLLMNDKDPIVRKLAELRLAANK